VTLTEAWKQLKHFTSGEFDSPDAPGSGATHMDPEFLLKLERMRERSGVAFRINSGYRTPKHNAKVGGVGDSAHVKGHAADIRAKTSQQRWKIVEAAIEQGIRRIGIAKTYVHVDDDPTLAVEVLWLYGA